MKKIVSVIIAAVVLMSALVTGASAAELIFSDNFDSGFSPSNWIQGPACAFQWDEFTGSIYGYSDALVLQSEYNAPMNKLWSDFYTTMDFQVKDIDDVTGEGGDTQIGIWYRDQFSSEEGGVSGAVYTYFICVQTGEATLNKSHTYTYTDEAGNFAENVIEEVIATATIPELIPVGENADFVTLGMLVTDGRMICYYEDQIIFDLTASADDEKIGGVAVSNIDSTVGTVPSPILFWNLGNWCAMDNFYVWEPAEKLAEATPVDTEAPETEESETEASETTTRIDTEIVTNDDGETEVVTQIVTEAVETEADVADTVNTTANAGPSTTTGDVTLAVVLAMVAALGTAVAVKKVRG